MINAQVRVLFYPGLVFNLFDHGFERLVLLTCPLLHAHNDVAVHLEEAPVRIPRETRVTALFGHDLHHLIVHAQVQDRVHHPRHGITSPGPDGQQKRVVAVPQLLTHGLLDFGQGRLNLVVEFRRITFFVLVKVSADFGRDREAGRHRQSDPRHLRQVRSFSTQKRPHLAITIRFTVPKIIDVPNLLGGFRLFGRWFRLFRRFRRLRRFFGRALLLQGCYWHIWNKLSKGLLEAARLSHRSEKLTKLAKVSTP